MTVGDGIAVAAAMWAIVQMVWVISMRNPPTTKDVEQRVKALEDIMLG